MHKQGSDAADSPIFNQMCPIVGYRFGALPDMTLHHGPETATDIADRASLSALTGC